MNQKTQITLIDHSRLTTLVDGKTFLSESKKKINTEGRENTLIERRSSVELMNLKLIFLNAKLLFLSITVTLKAHVTDRGRSSSLHLRNI